MKQRKALLALLPLARCGGGGGSASAATTSTNAGTTGAQADPDLIQAIVAAAA